MNNFTIKDFIKYNNPCFNCKNITEIKLHQVPLLTREMISPKIGNYDIDFIDFHTGRSYETKYSLIINLHNHEVVAKTKESKDYIVNYFNNHRLTLEKSCATCNCRIFTYALSFTKKDDSFVLDPIKISEEFLKVIQDGLYKYYIYCNYNENKSVIEWAREMREITIPLLPLSKFKTKEKIIEKINKLMIFL